MMTRRRAVALGTVLLVVALASLGLAHGLWAKTLTIDGTVNTGEFNADFTAASTDDPPGTLDPGYDKDVASCTATVVNTDLVEVVIVNAYPSYTCTFTTTIHNGGTVPERREPLEFVVPAVLTVKDLNDLTGVVLDPGQEDVEEFSVHVEQEAEQGAIYYFTIKKPFSLWVTGTIGFWKNWDSHNTFSETDIEIWLTEIDAASAWHGPTTVGGMDGVFAAAFGPSATPESRFLAHYLATRLNEHSGILDPADTHDVSGQDPGNYLNLADPSSATLSEIITAIESKHGTSPSNSQFNTMKIVCDALNKLDI